MPRPAVALVFSKVGPAEDCGGAEELAEAPEAIEMPIVHWHEAKCAGAEDLEEGAEDFGGVGAAGGIGREGFVELGREGIKVEALGF